MGTVLNFNPRVMIVESFGSNTKSLHGHLSSLAVPIEILAANDAESTLGRLQRERVDLFIIDTCLKGKMDGFDLCRAVRSAPLHQDASIILLLSGSLCLERSKGISAGADLLLHRPVVKEELLKMIQLLLGFRAETAAIPRPAYNNFAGPRLRSVS